MQCKNNTNGCQSKIINLAKDVGSYLLSRIALFIPKDNDRWGYGKIRPVSNQKKEHKQVRYVTIDASYGNCLNVKFRSSP